MSTATYSNVIQSNDASVLLCIAPTLVVESIDDHHATLYLQHDGTRLRIARALHALLLRFATPTSLEAIAQEQGVGAARALAHLRDKGFLAVPGAPVRIRPLTDPPLRLFDGASQKLSASSADLVVLGFPWDFGDERAAGARRGPVAFRETSLQLLYTLDQKSGLPSGWFDADLRRAVLAGMSIADAGDVLVRHGESTSNAFERAREVWRTLTSAGSIGVLLGGDSSVAFTPIEASSAQDPIDVIRFAPAPAQAPGAVGQHPTAATLPWHALACHGVRRYVDIVATIGRAALDAGPSIEGYRCTHPMCDEPVWLRALAEPGARLHIGIDMAAVHSAATPGVAYHDVKRILAYLGKTCRIVSIDLCGLNPWHPCWGSVSMTALHVLVAAMSAAKDSA